MAEMELLPVYWKIEVAVASCASVASAQISAAAEDSNSKLLSLNLLSAQGLYLHPPL